MTLKVGLVADTQGRFDVEALLSHVAEQFKGADEVWHAGDWDDSFHQSRNRDAAPVWRD